MTKYQPLEWLGSRIRILDQTLLPQEEKYVITADYLDVADSIRELRVRGAPAIGVAGGYGIALGAMAAYAGSVAAFRAKVEEVIDAIEATRPTAVNLFWATQRMHRVLYQEGTVDSLRIALVREAEAIHREESESSRRVSENGAGLISDGDTVLTHCNTGPLATTGYGTALGCIIVASRQGKKVKVLVDETRPLLQGSRLTAWELQKEGVPFTLITDSMAGYFMSRGGVNAVIVGADRIAANGDTANKIGTYGAAVLARAHSIPFYVAAPASTVDFSLRTGAEIKIEQRRPEEVTHIKGIPISPAGIEVANPSFDVTPAAYVTAIITQDGIIRKPLRRGLSLARR
jgi:methylthioribose-1-phosphate isomerase